MKNEFVSMVSHELRTPLTSIRGSLGLILGGVGGPLNEQLQNLLEIAQKNSERLLVLINDILDIEKIEAGRINFEIRPLPLLPLLEQILQVNQAYAENYGVQMRLQVDPDCEGCQIRADSHRLTPRRIGRLAGQPAAGLVTPCRSGSRARDPPILSPPDLSTVCPSGCLRYAPAGRDGIGLEHQQSDCR
jgi:hypothetical protein